MTEIESIKQAALDYPVHPLIASRWSPRAFDSKPIENEKLQHIFEAARWTASSSNLQPWYFLVGFKEDEVYEKIISTMVEFNQLWAKTAPVLVLAISARITAKGEQNHSHAYDLGQAVSALSLQATADGIFVHQMGGFDKEKAKELLEIPESFSVQVAFAMGYRTDEEILHPKIQKLERSPRERRPVSETVFTGSFGHSADFL